jgi:hypothetical protein
MMYVLLAFELGTSYLLDKQSTTLPLSPKTYFLARYSLICEMGVLVLPPSWLVRKPYEMI